MDDLPKPQELQAPHDDDQWTRWIGQECANPNYCVCATHYFQTNGVALLPQQEAQHLMLTEKLFIALSRWVYPAENRVYLPKKERI
jgi:hypothetical protein